VLSGAHIGVVVPAYNEAAWIEETLATIPAFVDRVAVVDDASIDGTGDIARRSGDSRVDVLRHEKNRGVGAAIATGYRHVRARGASVAAVMAGDGQMDPADLERVVSPVVRGEADYVKGNRTRHPEALRAMPLARLAGTSGLAVLTSLASGVRPLGDSQCGYTAISAAAIDLLDLDRLWPGYGYPNDLLGALAARRLRITEVTVRPVYRGEASGLGVRHLGTIAFLLARVAIRRRRSGR
jgi:glycosyltransferase involved in cell wall biosynthesis